tara:strand:+ start:760 stop:2394 length:1635 start_codon:yes stop_codon:yes gene_type:complete
MEKILKIQSEAGFSETAIADPAGFGQFINSKLVDLIIPGNGTYDLSKSYININMEVVSEQAGLGGLTPTGVTPSDTAIYNNDIQLFSQDVATVVGAVPCRSPCSMMVRNADMFSANRGMVESIRRVNTLRSVLSNIEDDLPEIHDGLDRFGAASGRRGIGNRTSSLVQIIGSNVNNGGVADVTQKALNLSRDYRIPISDLFGVGNAQWNGDVYGDTRIHLELQPNLLRVQSLGGNEEASVFDPAGQNKFWGQMEDYTVASGLGQLGATEALGTIASGNPLVTSITYNDFQLNCPFYVGQAITATLTSSVGGALTPNPVIIDAIEFNQGTNAAGGVGTGSLQIWTRTTVHTAAGAPEDITAILVKAHLSLPATDKIRINRAEIVLSEMVGVNGPDKINYRTYSTEETQGSAGLLTLNRQIICEPNAQNLIVASCGTGVIDARKEWTNYRIAINNVDQTGNRDVAYNRPLHKDRILRFEQNRGTYPSNTSLQLVATDENQVNQEKNAYPILETLPLTATSKIVNLEMVAAAAPEDVIFFKELVRVI